MSLRLRFLSEKYGLDPLAWLQDIPGLDDDLDPQTEMPDIVEMLDQERQSDD
jgi:hypothetical protein